MTSTSPRATEGPAEQNPPGAPARTIRSSRSRMRRPTTRPTMPNTAMMQEDKEFHISATESEYT